MKPADVEGKEGDPESPTQQRRIAVEDSQKQFFGKDLSLEQVKALFHVDKLVSKRGRFSRFRHYLRCLALRLSTDEAKQMFDDEALMSTVREQADLVPREPEFFDGLKQTSPPQPEEDADPDTEIAALERKIET